MEKIKTYEQFNEEINLKKGLAGLALGASLLGGQSCIKTDLVPSTRTEVISNNPNAEAGPIFMQVESGRYKLEYYSGTSWLALSGGVGGAATITVDTFTILNEDSSGTPRDSYSPLSLTPVADQNVLVFLGGVYQPPSAYNINTDSTSPYIKMLALVSGDIGSSLVVIHGFDSV